MNFGELIAKGGALFARKGADALADTLETAPPADLARIQASVSGAKQGLLRHWFSGASLSGKKIAWVGDSTVYQIFAVAQNLNYLNTEYVNNLGSALYGVTNLPFGANGNTIENFMAGTPAGYGVLDVIAAAPDLVIFNYGINSVRLQGSALTAQGLATYIRAAINQIRAALPNCDFVLRVPNSLLTTNVGALGYVVPNAWAQSASDILRDAYRLVKYDWDNCVTWDSRVDVFPDTCPATSINMVDQLHPTNVPAGYKRIIDGLMATIGRPPVYNKGRNDDAQALGYIDDYTRYPLVTENGVDYDLITSGQWSGSAASYIDFSGNLLSVGGFRAGDVVVQSRTVAWALPQSFAQAVSGNNIRLSGLGTLVQTQTGGDVYVYRRRYAGVPIGKNYYTPGGSPKYPFAIRVGTSAGAGANYLRMQVGTGTTPGQLFAAKSGDILLHPTLGAVTISATFEFSVDTWQISQSADFTMPAGVYECLVVGVSRDTVQSGIKLFSPGALTNSVVRDIPAVGGIYKTVSASLGTAGSGATTVVIARAGTTVLTLTFAAGSTSPTLAWAAGSQFCSGGGKLFTATITAGVGAADLAIGISA